MDISQVKTHDEMDEMSLAHRLAGAVRFPTISNPDYARTDTAAFQGLLDYFQQIYPLIHQRLKWEVISDSSLLFEWTGSDPALKPVLLTGHIDVVPVEPATLNAWTYPPFDGCVEQEYIWGRGTLDDKVTVMGLMEAVESLLRRGFHPRRTIYLAFAEDEEVMGQRGAPTMAALLKARGLEMEFILDEGMVITDGIIPHVTRPAALIGITERGFVVMELTVEKVGGHLGMPPKETAIGILCAAVSRLEKHPLPPRVDSPTFQTLDALAPEMPRLLRAMIKAKKLTRGLLFKQLSAEDSTNAMIRTSIAFTMFHAGEQVNVLTANAKATVVFFPMPGESIASIAGYARKVINDPRVQLNVFTGNYAEASPVSPVDSAGYRFIEAAIRKVFPGVLVAPAIGGTPTDCRCYVGLSENCYRFTPLWLRPEDVLRIHGVNERISIRNYSQVMEFDLDLIESSCG